MCGCVECVDYIWAINFLKNNFFLIMIQVANIEIATARPQDLKTKSGDLAVGKPFIVLDEKREHVICYDALNYDLDLIIIKELLDAKRICVPIEDHSFKQFIQLEEDEPIQ